MDTLNKSNQEMSWGRKNEIAIIGFFIFLAGCIAKIPDILSIRQDYFYQRNFSFIVFPFLIAYYAWKQNLNWRQLMLPIAVMLFAVIYINCWPIGTQADSYVQACIHMALMLWMMFGFSYAGANWRDEKKAIAFLRYNGDLIVMGSIIVLSGILFIALSVGLFKLIDVKIDALLEHYILVWGLPAVPIIANFLVSNNPHFVNRISPVIAKIFTPFVLLMLTLFLVTIVYTGKYPYNDRSFLLVFNALLIGVMALILFSTAEATQYAKHSIQIYIVFCLSLVTIIINGIALSAILFRIIEFGWTPNRVAALGGDMLILSHLIMVTMQLFSYIKNKATIDAIEKSIVNFMPVYFIWAAQVTFLLPLIFHFK